jgi:hypothetical protein
VVLISDLRPDLLRMGRGKRGDGGDGDHGVVGARSVTLLDCLTP